MLLTKLANQEIVNFLRTVTIKNSYFADQIAASCVNVAYNGSLSAELNPYYLHLTGQYILKDPVTATVTDPNTGVKFTQTYKDYQTTTDNKGNTITVSNKKLYAYGFDEMMYVTSLDTKEEIPFTRENLHGCGGNTAIHKKTLEAYKVGGNYFNLLCEKYPKQVDLIKSIVYLIPPKELSSSEKAAYSSGTLDEDYLRMRNAIDSKNFTLLQFDDTFLEDREKQSILDCVRAVLEMFRTRWCVNEYVFEENYANVLWAVLWSILPLAIAGQRYSNIRGPNAHSSHIWDYLTSHGLDSYRGYLSADQEAFLYKNIRYLRQHGGEHRILNILVDNLLAEYNLHIEQKTVVYDTSKVLDTASVGTSYASQCSICARRSVCYKNIKTYKCLEFLGIKETCKPTSVILSEELQGATKKRIITLLKSRYGCTDEEAEFRYNRSFLWRDEAIELIRSELDKIQTTERSLITEDLDTTIQREHASALEPVYNDGVVERQHTELRHARSAIIPTKLLEIVEDPTEPKYEEMFARFLTDTLLHLAPYIKNNESINYVNDTFKVIIGQEATQVTLTFGELLAAMYVGFIREYSPNLIVDNNGSVRFTKDRTNGTYESTIDNRSVLTDFNKYQTYGFKVPTSANIGSTFKLGMPIKQEDLVSAYESGDESIAELGTYQETSDLEPDEEKVYFTLVDGNYKQETDLEVFSDDTTYYEFITLPQFVTNGDSDDEDLFEDPDTGEVVKFKVVSIDGRIYAVRKKDLPSSPTKGSSDWTPYGYIYEVLGRFSLSNQQYSYKENGGEIPVIPTYFKWFSKHLGIYEHYAVDDLKKLTAVEEGAIGRAWGNKSYGNLEANPPDYGLYIFHKDGGWSQFDGSGGAYVQIRRILQVTSEGTPEPLTAHAAYENILEDKDVGNNSVEYAYTDAYPPYGIKTDELTEIGARENDDGYISDVVISSDGSTRYVLCQLYPETHGEEYDLVKLDRYVNVDYIINHLYKDAFDGINSQEELGEYIESLFTMTERLDMIRTSCGDTKTHQAICTFFKAVTIDRTTKKFNLLGAYGASDPTYDDWFVKNAELGDAIKKLDGSEQVELAWNEFNLKLFSTLLKYCKLSYVTSSTSKTRYRKLKELVKSLSSYLVNYIDNEGSDSTSTELSHLKEDTSEVKLQFTSYIDFDPVCQTFNYVQIGDLDKDIYLPASEVTAKEGVEYYVYNLVSSEGIEDAYRYDRDNVEIGEDLRGNQRYFRVNFREALDLKYTEATDRIPKSTTEYFIKNSDETYVSVGTPEEFEDGVTYYVTSSTAFRVWNINGSWYYQVGKDTSVELEAETYPADNAVTSSEAGVLTEVAQSMMGTSKDPSIAKYFKQVECITVNWNTRSLPSSSYGSLKSGTEIPLAAGALGIVRGIYGDSVIVEILLPVPDKCKEYLDLMVRSFHTSIQPRLDPTDPNCTAEVVFESAVAGYSPAELADSMVLSDEMVITKRTSQL